MLRAHRLGLVVGPALVMMASVGGRAIGQQTVVTVPQVGISDSFFENYGVHWNGGFFRPGGYLFANSGGGGVGVPFGGFDPNAGASFGVGGFRGGGSFGFGFSAAQGSQRSIVAEAPSVTVMNGASGFFSDTTIRPFVTGVVPVLGGGPPPVAISPLAIKLEQLQAERMSGGARRETREEPLSLGNGESEAPARAAASPASDRSSAETGAPGLAELRRRRAQEDAAAAEAANAAFAESLERARRAERDNKPKLATFYYQQALRAAPHHPDADAIRRQLKGRD